MTQTFDAEGLYLPAYKPKRVLCLAFAVWRLWTDLRVIYKHRMRMFYLPSSATEEERYVCSAVPRVLTATRPPSLEVCYDCCLEGLPLCFAPFPTCFVVFTWEYLRVLEAACVSLTGHL